MYKNEFHPKVLFINNISGRLHKSGYFSNLKEAQEHFARKDGFSNYDDYCNYYKIETVLERTHKEAKNSEFIRKAAYALLKNSHKIEDLEYIFDANSTVNYELLDEIVYLYTDGDCAEYGDQYLEDINDYEIKLFLQYLMKDLQAFQGYYYDYDDVLSLSNMEFLPSAIEPKHADAILLCLGEIENKPLKRQYLSMHNILVRILSKNEVEFEDLSEGGILKCKLIKEIEEKSLKLIESSYFDTYTDGSELLSYKIHKDCWFYLTNGYLQEYMV